MPLALTHPVFKEHETGNWHPDSPQRLDAALEGVRRAGLEPFIPPEPHPDTIRMIRKIHDATIIEKLDKACASGKKFFGSLDNSISEMTAEAARTAVSTGLHAAQALLERGERSFVIARPPGHHAEAARPIGFCYFNTIACAADWLLENASISRIFIVDWDVHHGNGTQQIFEERGDVFYFSLHSYPFFPGTGAEDERGTGEGEGTTRNIPLHSGTGDETYLRLFEREIIPEIERFEPDAILISAGFDAHRKDPIGNMAVSTEAFGEMTRMIVEVAESACNGRVASFLEGGYSLDALTDSVALHLERL